MRNEGFYSGLRLVFLIENKHAADSGATQNCPTSLLTGQGLSCWELPTKFSDWRIVLFIPMIFWTIGPKKRKEASHEGNMDDCFGYRNGDGVYSIHGLSVSNGGTNRGDQVSAIAVGARDTHPPA